MRVSRRIKYLFLLLGGCFSLLSCSDSIEKSSQTAEILLKSSFEQPSTSSALEYRNIFYSYAKNEFHYPETELRNLLYTPTKELLDTAYKDHLNSDTPWNELRKSFAQTRVSELYKEGFKIPWNQYTKAELEESFQKSGPVTFILFPALLTELSNSFMFSDVFADTGSNLAKEFSSKYLAHIEPEDKFDPVYSLENETYLNKSLLSSLKVASIDDNYGKPLVNLVLLYPNNLSMETIGTLEQTSETYLRRVDKILKIMPSLQDNLYILGHSRGSNVGLEFIVRARERAEHFVWANKIRGLVSFSGVTFGTDFADSLFPNFSELTPTNYKMTGDILNYFDQNLRNVKVTDKTPSKLATIAHNSRIFLWGLKTFVKNLGSLFIKPVDQGINVENLPLFIPGKEMLKSITGIYSQLTGLNHPFTDYPGTMRRFKIYLHNIVIALKELTTNSRSSWWTAHKLPHDIKIFSISASMPGITKSGEIPNKLLYNHNIASPNSIDYRMIRTFYYLLYGQSHVEINDCLVPLDKSVFWPSLVKHFDEDFPLENLYWTGIHSTNHLGMGFSVLYKNANIGTDPYPRKLVLKTLATFISRIQEK